MKEITLKNNKPQVSIGLPVYNGENYLKEAIDSILAQTFTDFELIISDNASTDKTPGICREYAAKDPRIRYYRNEKNQGASWNFNNVFKLSTGEYFKWAAHDDLIAPDYISKCVEVLDKDNTIILCSSRVQFIDKNGDVIACHVNELNKVNSLHSRDRFSDLIYLGHWCLFVFGLIRSDALRKTSLIKAYPDSDRGLLVELGLLGRFHKIPQNLFFNREHPERFTMTYKNIYLRGGWFDPSKEGKITLWTWNLFFEYFRFIHRSSLSLYDRVYCYMHMGNWMRLSSRRMGKELIFIIIYSGTIQKFRNKLSKK